MDHKDMFLKYWEKEAPATRKVISRIPQDRGDYRPDPKSRTAPEIAWLIVREEILLAEGLEKGKIEWVEAPVPAAVKEILAEYDRHHDKVTARLHTIPAHRWEESLPMLFGGQEVMRDTHTIWPGDSYSIKSIIEASFRRTCDPWAQKCPPSTDPAPTNPHKKK